MKKLLLGLLALASVSTFALEDPKAGDKAIHLGTLGNVIVEILSVNEDSSYTVKYNSTDHGPDRTYWNTPREDLVMLSMAGCSGDMCVGDIVNHLRTNVKVEVEIIAIAENGNYVTRYESIYSASKTYINTPRSDLSRTLE